MERRLASETDSTVSIVQVVGDAEAQRLAGQLKQIFERSGWKVSGIRTGFFTEPPQGLFIKVNNQQTYPRRAQVIHEALQLARLNSLGQADEHLSEDDVELLVGSQ